MRFRPGLETLEPRCLLSVAPATDYLPSAAALLPSVPSFGRVPAPIIGLPTTPRNPYDWPPSVPENPPPIQSPPDYSDQGGPIDLGGFTQPPVIVKDAKGNEEAKEVLALLAALTYVPSGGSSPETTAASAPATALDPARTSVTDERRVAQGGLVTVARSELPAAESTDSAMADLDAWLEAPVRMEGNRGRFQIFEISTTESVRPRPRESADCEFPAVVPEASVPGFAVPESAAPEAGDLPPNVSAPVASTPESPTDEQPEPVAALAAPLAVDESTSWWLNAAAVTALLAYFVRTARPATEDKNQDGLVSPVARSIAHWPARNLQVG